jgi:hypothetical protein
VIYNKIGWVGGGLFVAKLGGGRRNREGGEKGCFSDHKLNIIDSITEKIHRRVNFIGNSICMKNMLLYFLIVF